MASSESGLSLDCVERRPRTDLGRSLWVDSGKSINPRGQISHGPISAHRLIGDVIYTPLDAEGAGDAEMALPDLPDILQRWFNGHQRDVVDIRIA